MIALRASSGIIGGNGSQRFGRLGVRAGHHRDRFRGIALVILFALRQQPGRIIEAQVVCKRKAQHVHIVDFRAFGVFAEQRLDDLA